MSSLCIHLSTIFCVLHFCIFLDWRISVFLVVCVCLQKQFSLFHLFENVIFAFIFEGCFFVQYSVLSYKEFFFFSPLKTVSPLYYGLYYFWLEVSSYLYYYFPVWLLRRLFCIIGSQQFDHEVLKCGFDKFVAIISSNIIFCSILTLLLRLQFMLAWFCLIGHIGAAHLKNLFFPDWIFFQYLGHHGVHFYCLLFLLTICHIFLFSCQWFFNCTLDIDTL